MEITLTRIGNVLTRTGGYLSTVTSHSLQPYRGCSLGQSLCGVGCYVRHHAWVTRGREWGTFLDVRENAADSYIEHYPAEQRWARGRLGRFSIFLSSATEPFPPQEKKFGITRRVLGAMVDHPPDLLILQTHTHGVVDVLDTLRELAARCEVRVHISIESDRDGLPGLPMPGATVERRFAAAQAVRDAGLRTVITVSPLLPMDDPAAFFRRADACADAVVIDHFIGGDGTATGSRTRRTALPAAMAAVDPRSTELAYRDEIVGHALEIFSGEVGVGIDGFAGRYLQPTGVSSAPWGGQR